MSDLDHWTTLAAEGQLVRHLLTQGIVARRFSPWEVETKHDIVADGPPHALLERIVARADLLTDWVTDGCTAMEPRYVIRHGFEYSYFEYRSLPLVKIKRHHVRYAGPLPVMVSTEQFVEGNDARIWAAGQDPSDFIGPLQKQRAKVFLVAPESAVTFAAAVTVCRYAGQVQRQFELEYHASPAGPSAGPRNLDEVVETTAAAAVRIVERAPIRLVPTTETKLQFLLRTGARSFYRRTG